MTFVTQACALQLFFNQIHDSQITHLSQLYLTFYFFPYSFYVWQHFPCYTRQRKIKYKIRNTNAKKHYSRGKILLKLQFSNLALPRNLDRALRQTLRVRQREKKAIMNHLSALSVDYQTRRVYMTPTLHTASNSIIDNQFLFLPHIHFRGRVW